MGSHGDRVSHIEVHVTSTCTTQSEFALLLRPLYREGLLYIPSTHSIAKAGTSFALRITLHDQEPVLRAHARLVDPFSRGLTTGGYPGFAVELSEIDSPGQAFITELTRSFDGTLPFGVPTSILGDERIMCRVQLEEELGEAEFSPSPGAELASPHRINDSVQDESTAIEDDAEQSPELGPLIRTPGGQLTPNPSYSGMPTSILFGPGEGLNVLPKAGTRTDSIRLRSLNRSLLLSTLVAASLGVLIGYFVWGRGVSVPSTPTSTQADAALLQPTKATKRATLNEPSIQGKGEKNETPKPIAPQSNAKAVAATDEPKARPSLPAPSPCLLKMTTNPEGAALFAKSVFVGVSPFDGPVSCDLREIDIQHPDFNAAHVKLKWQGKAAQATVELERPHVMVMVTLNSIPRKATVRRGGEFLGKTPLQIRLPAFEPSKITIARKGFSSETIELTPTQKGKNVRTIRLRRKR